MITLDLSILNQKGTPMFYSDITANRPAAGISGRIFIATDSPYGLFRDTGSAWEQIAAGGGTSGITGSGTATQVAFFDAESNIISDADLYWDNTNKRLGIGTTTPTKKLDIHGSGILATFNGTGTNNAFITFDNAGANKWRLGNVYSTGTNYFQLYDDVSSVTRLRWDNTGQAQFQGYFDFLASSTNDVATFRAAQANVTIKATGATNPVSLTFDPAATYESVIQAINTGGYFQFKTNSITRNQILNDGKNTINSTPLVSSSDGWYSINTQAISTIPASTSFGNLGYVMGSVAGLNLMTYAGSATYAQANVAASIFGLNSFTFSAGSSTITMNQGAAGIRAYTGFTAQNQFSGINSGTITHVAGIQTLGLYNNATGVITPTITNYYGLLINSSTEYGHTFTITNKWGIYQAGANDDNYFGGKLINTYKYNRQTASYTLTASDRSKLVEMNVATANNLTIPLDSSVPFEIGTQIEVSQYGAGQTTIVATGGVTIRSASGNLKIASQYVAVSLLKIGTNEWYCFGNLSA